MITQYTNQIPGTTVKVKDSKGNVYTAQTGETVNAPIGCTLTKTMIVGWTGWKKLN